MRESDFARPWYARTASYQSLLRRGVMHVPHRTTPDCHAVAVEEAECRVELRESLREYRCRVALRPSGERPREVSARLDDPVNFIDFFGAQALVDAGPILQRLCRFRPGSR